MKQFITAGALAIVLVPEALADTDIDTSNRLSGFYAAVRGYGSIEDQNNFIFEDSREVAVAAGWRASEVWRVEAEYGARWSNIAGLNGASGVRGDSRIETFGLHAFRDFRKGKKIRPFLGAGGGLATLDFVFEGPADIDPSFIVSGQDEDDSYYINFFAGSSYHFNERWRLSGGVEYVTLKDQSIDSNLGGIDGINRAYNFFVGARYFFGPTGH
jgi:opacity protein-like surface antigen